MAELIKPTFFAVTKRPLNSLPSDSDEQRRTVADMPRGTVKDRIRFYEQLKESNSVSPSRRATVDGVLGRSRLNERVNLDNPEVISVREPDARPEQQEVLLETPLAARVFNEDEEEQRQPAEDQAKSDDRELQSLEEVHQQAEVPIPVSAEPVTKPWQPAVHFPATRPSLPPQAASAPTNFFPSRDPELDESLCRPQESEWSVTPMRASINEAVTQDAEIDAICVNCQEYISLDQIDSHSLTCVQPFTETSHEEETMLRLRKLHRAISRRAKEAAGEKLFVLLRLRELAAEALKLDHSKAELELDDLALSSLSMEGGVGCSVLARRLATLLSELQNAVPEGLTLTTENLLNHYNAEVERQRRELRKWKAHAQVLEALAGTRVIDEVHSDVGSDADSAVSSQGSVDVAEMKDAEEALQAVSEDQLRRYFYSQCLKMKLLLPKTHPGQKVLVSTLYEEARNLPVARWRRFIKMQLESKA